MSRLPRVVAVVGPTGSGKTELALALAKQFHGEIVGVDASQIYRGFNIGTGKVTAEELEGVTHHNLDLIAPDEAYDAARFARETTDLIATMTKDGKTPILCGGSGLYFRALRDGLCRAPKVPKSLQAAVLSEIDALGVSEMHRQLAQFDPITAGRVHFNDRQRVERAISVYRFTGRSLSDWIEEGTHDGLAAHWLVLGLRWSPDVLRSRIATRVDKMFALGWMDEVKRIVEDGHDEAVRAFSAIGYRIVLQVIEGELSFEDGKAEIIRQTQRYAKRQMTWFRREQGVQWLDCPFNADAVHSEVGSFLEGGDL